jgi:hypothetical protein
VTDVLDTSPKLRNPESAPRPQCGLRPGRLATTHQEERVMTNPADSTKLSRRSLLASATAAAAIGAPATAATLGGLPTGAAATSDADPIFAAIEVHRKANNDWSAVLARLNAELEKLGPGHMDEAGASYQESEAADDREGRAYWAFWHTMPTTVAGMAAYFQYLAEPRWLLPDGEDERDYGKESRSMIDDAIGGAWHPEYGSDGGDGGVPGVLDWVRTMELALRRIAATA